MRASISISKLACLMGITTLLSVALPLAYADDPNGIAPPASGSGGTPEKRDRSIAPEEEDYSTTPFTEYGEFNEEDDEAEDSRFFQHGRFFGISIGAGTAGATGNRGSVLGGGFPTIDLKFHYWFDFNFALTLGFFNSQFSYAVPTDNDVVDVNFNRIGLDLKYYFDTRNLSAAITFVNPFLELGGGSFNKAEFSQNSKTTDYDTKFGLTAGGGLEFILKPKKIYFQLEGRAHFVNFKDTNSTKFASRGIADLNGIFYTGTGNLLFTW